MSDLHIRGPSVEDMPALEELNSYGLAAAGIDPQDDIYQRDDASGLEETYLAANRGCALVGEVSGAVVAMGSLRQVDKQTCEILRMRVSPDYQGNGYGTAMLARLELEARKLGYSKMTLITGVNQHPAVDLYRKHGFLDTEYIELLGIPSVRMSKHL